jgi:hypothetical protein
MDRASVMALALFLAGLERGGILPLPLKVERNFRLSGKGRKAGKGGSE